MDYHLRFKVTAPDGKASRGQYIIAAASDTQAENEGRNRALKDKIAPYYFPAREARRFQEIVQSPDAKFEVTQFRILGH